MSTNTAERLRVAATSDPDEEKRKLAAMKPKEQVAYLLTKKKDEIAKMLPRHLDAERLLKVATIAATTTPALAKCDVASLVAAIGQCAQLGLEPNTVLGHAYLVPFNTKRKDADGNERWVNSVQVIIGYKGLIDLARRSGQIVSIAAHEVCANDKFELAYGLEEKLNHAPALKDRGELMGFYAVAKLVGGGYAFEWMSLEQILTVRDGSQGWQQAVKFKAQDKHPWTVHLIEMGRKTVIRRLAKYLPLSIEFQRAVDLDGQAASGKDQRLDAIDGDFLNVGETDDLGSEGEEPPPPALPDDTQVQADNRVPQQTAEPEKERAPAPASKPRAARAAAPERAEEPPGALQLIRKITSSLASIKDTETAYLKLDEARSLVGEIDGNEIAEAQELVDAAAAALRARDSGANGQMSLD